MQLKIIPHGEIEKCKIRECGKTYFITTQPGDATKYEFLVVIDELNVHITGKLLKLITIERWRLDETLINYPILGTDINYADYSITISNSPLFTDNWNIIKELSEYHLTNPWTIIAALRSIYEIMKII